MCPKAPRTLRRYRAPERTATLAGAPPMLMVVDAPRMPDRLASSLHRRYEQGDQQGDHRENGQHLD
jgi:hypothetical protein